MTDEVVTGIDITHKGKTDTLGTYGEHWKEGVRLSASNTWGSSRTTNNAWTQYTDSSVTRPGGGSWAVADFNSLQAGVTVNAASYSCGKSTCYAVGYLTQIYITVNYGPAPTPTPHSEVRVKGDTRMKGNVRIKGQ